MKKEPIILKAYRWLIILLGFVAIMGVISIFFYNDSNAKLIDGTFTCGVSALCILIFMGGFYYIVKAACVYIEENEKKG